MYMHVMYTFSLYIAQFVGGFSSFFPHQTSNRFSGAVTLEVLICGCGLWRCEILHGSLCNVNNPGDNLLFLLGLSFELL